jgi:translation initiation factor IF-3
VITLIGTDNSLSVVSFTEAEKLAKRRDLKLVKIIDVDTKTHRPIYQLMTVSQYCNEDKKRRQEKTAQKESGYKGEKLLTLSHRITSHDLSSRLKNIRKWLSKTYEVRIVINGDSENLKCAVSAPCTSVCVCVGFLGLFMRKSVAHFQ